MGQSSCRMDCIPYLNKCKNNLNLNDNDDQNESVQGKDKVRYST